jgi:hypothetical protein
MMHSDSQMHTLATLILICLAGCLSPICVCSTSPTSQKDIDDCVEDALVNEWMADFETMQGSPESFRAMVHEFSQQRPWFSCLCECLVPIVCMHCET